jgi:hypothetical protein
MIEKVTLINHESNISGNCVSSAKIIKMLEDERKLALGPGVNSRALKPMSRTAGLRYVSLVAPVVIRNPDIQNQRRLDAKDDVYNQVSLAAVATAILAPPVSGGLSAYEPGNIHCIDAMSVLLFDRLNEPVRVGKTTRQEMNDKHRSISTTKENPQARTVKCYFDTSADGLLNQAIICITDNLFVEERKWFQLDSGFNHLEIWVLLMRKKKIIKELTNANEINKENIPNNSPKLELA